MSFFLEIAAGMLVITDHITLDKSSYDKRREKGKRNTSFVMCLH